MSNTTEHNQLPFLTSIHLMDMKRKIIIIIIIQLRFRTIYIQIWEIKIWMLN